jgi:hypothetical protein
MRAQRASATARRVQRPLDRPTVGTIHVGTVENKIRHAPNDVREDDAAEQTDDGRRTIPGSVNHFAGVPQLLRIGHEQHRANEDTRDRTAGKDQRSSDSPSS